MTSTSSPTRKLALLFGSVTLLAASFLLTTPRTASAAPAQSCFCSYYTNGVQTGEYDVYCTGHIEHWGTRTGTAVCDCEIC
ncbi:MAG TPA: hypothetical protein VIE43_12725 [Thermoanaerobaculia bacterium]|jgi:hypothetical protein|nr:hypothetical protein [Thermoanaerobaculia bacterium]